MEAMNICHQVISLGNFTKEVIDSPKFESRKILEQSIVEFVNKYGYSYEKIEKS